MLEALTIQSMWAAEVRLLHVCTRKPLHICPIPCCIFKNSLYVWVNLFTWAMVCDFIFLLVLDKAFHLAGLKWGYLQTCIFGFWACRRLWAVHKLLAHVMSNVTTIHLVGGFSLSSAAQYSFTLQVWRCRRYCIVILVILCSRLLVCDVLRCLIPRPLL